MSPLLDIQRQHRTIGRIRIGRQVPSKDGKSRPEKLSTFRLTTRSRPVADAVAELLGGHVADWKPEHGEAQFEVITDRDTLSVIIPPGMPVQQHYELWSGGGCLRRCDGQTESLSGKPCMCPPPGVERATAAANGGACKPTTRLRVMLPDLPDLGVWLLASGGYYAAVELAGTADLLHQAATAGALVPATLRLEQRSVIRNKQTRKYAVPVLELGVTPRQLVSGEGIGDLPAALQAAPSVAAITAGEPEQPAERVTAQQLADIASKATMADEVKDAGRRAREAGLLQEFVDQGDGVCVPLENHLYERLEAFEAAS